MGFFGSLFGGNCITNTAYVSAATKQAAAIAKQAAADIAIQVGVALCDGIDDGPVLSSTRLHDLVQIHCAGH